MAWKFWAIRCGWPRPQDLERMDLKTGNWSIYDHNNTVMHEPWVYSVTGAKDRRLRGRLGRRHSGVRAVRGTFLRNTAIRTAIFISISCPTTARSMTSLPGSPGPTAFSGRATYFGMSRYDGSRGEPGRKKNRRSSPISSISSMLAVGSPGSARIAEFQSPTATPGSTITRTKKAKAWSR